MSLNNSTKQRFMERTSEYSTRGSSRGINLLGWEEQEYLTAKQEREALVAAYKSLEEKIVSLPKNSKERRECSLVKNDIAKQISALRQRLSGPRDTRSFFIEVAKEILCKSTYNAIMKEATNRAITAADMRKEAL